MTRRRLIPESEFAGTKYAQSLLAWRRQILRDTVARFDGEGLSHYRALAQTNLKRWQSQAKPKTATVVVLPNDWGEVALQLTKQHGAIFAVLNMANAVVPGGGYLEGLGAQEENMFRRTDCHLSINDEQLQPDGQRYRREMTECVEGCSGTVYLDHEEPRVCIRGAETIGRLAGYEWLPESEVFPFYELRAAARDYRHNDTFDLEDARKRICAQLDTLIQAQQRHAVLGASGCGAFANPPATIAKLYSEELARRQGAFDCVAFAVLHTGYGLGNYPVFHRELHQDYQKQ